MKTLVVLDEQIVRFLLLLCQTARGVGTPDQELIRDDAEQQLKVALLMLAQAKKQEKGR